MGAAAQILLVMMLCSLVAFGSVSSSASDRADGRGENPGAVAGVDANVSANERVGVRGENPGAFANDNADVSSADASADENVAASTNSPTIAVLSAPGHRVRAADHRAFWLWSGVGSSAEMREAEVVYLHQGEVNLYRGSPVFERVGLPVSRLSFPRIWLTVRLTTLEMPDDISARIIGLMTRWSQSGNHVVGLQIDFDAATRKLDDYAQFLTALRQKLPREYALGVTGLLDWASTGDIATLNRLPVDELVVQTYQGRNSVQGYASYLPALQKLHIPFRVGLVQHGEWEPRYERELSASRWYRGTVVFMLRPGR